MNDLKKKLKEISTNSKNFLSTQNLPSMDDNPSSDAPTNINTYNNNDTLSKLSEIKNKLNLSKKNTLTNTNIK